MPAFSTMSYAIITVGGKQYRVSEGQRLLVDRLPVEDGRTFTPGVLLVGGEGPPQLAPPDVIVTAKVVGQQRGPKIRIGKYKKRTGYRRNTGFRAALTQIEIESIGGAKPRTAKAKAKSGAPAEPKAEAVAPEAVSPEAVSPEAVSPEAVAPEAVSAEAGADAATLPEGYAGLT